MCEGDHPTASQGSGSTQHIHYPQRVHGRADTPGMLVFNTLAMEKFPQPSSPDRWEQLPTAEWQLLLSRVSGDAGVLSGMADNAMNDRNQAQRVAELRGMLQVIDRQLQSRRTSQTHD